MPSLRDLYNRGVVEVVDDNTSLGNGFEALRFSGVGVDLTDAGDKTAIVNITGGGGSSGGDPNVGILAHWSFNEANDTPRVDSVSNIELLEVNNPGISTGILGNAVNFSGTGGKLLRNQNNTILSINNIDWSISFWLKMVKPADQTGDVPIIIVSKDSGGTREYNIQYQAGDAWGDGSRGIYLMINGNPLIKLIDSSFIQNNTWQLITITHDVSTKRVEGYLNSTQRGSGTYSATTVTGNADFWVGQTTTLNSATVEIDEVGIWTRILNGSDIVEIYSGGNGDSYPYTLTEGGTGGGTALTVKNSSGSTTVTNVDTITVSGLLLSDQGNGDITLISSGGGGGTQPLSLNSDIFSYWRLDGDGNQIDLTGNDRTLQNNNVSVSSNTRITTSSRFNGFNSYYSIQNSLISGFNLGDWTISLWFNFVRLPDTTGDSNFALLGKDDPNAREIQLQYQAGTAFGPTRGLYLLVNSDSIPRLIVPKSEIEDNTWQHLVLTKNTSSKSVIGYINGVEVGNFNYPNNDVSNAKDFILGAVNFTSVGQFYDGLMAEVGLWRRILSQEEVQDLFTQNTTNFYPFSVPEPEPLFTFNNNGTGEGEVYKQTSGSEVQLRNIKSGSNVSITQTEDDIVINSAGGGTALTVRNASGSTTVSNVETITVSGLVLSDQGNGDITLISSGGDGGEQSTIDLNVGLFSHYTFNQTTGNYIDSSPNSLDLSAQGNLLRNSQGLDGSTSYMEIVSTGDYLEELSTGYSNFNANSWSMSIRLRLNKVISNEADPDDGVIIGRQNQSVGNEFNIFYYGGTATNLVPNGLVLYLDTTYYLLAPPEDIPEDTWFNLGVVKNKEDKKLECYIDGVKISDISYSANDVSGLNLTLTVGASNWSPSRSYTYEGLKIQELTTWSRVLSSEEILYQNGLTIDDYPLEVLEPEPLFTFNNNGTGEGEVYRQTSGSEVQLRNIKSGSNISITQTEEDIVINSTGGVAIPGTSKGDILVHDGTEYVKLPLGLSGQVLQVDPNEPVGIKWANFKTGDEGIGDTFIPAKFLGASSPGVYLWLDVDPFANQKTIIEVDYRFKAINLNTTIADQDIITEVTQLNSN